MCGIVGILRFDGEPVRRAEIEAMTAAVAHRGPDGEGCVVKGSVALGHRRLAIIDIARGAQPMTNADESVWLTYNGEIYNYRELTRELRDLGHHFRTRSDTEVLLHAYEQWGSDCLGRLRGMFAFGLVDSARRRFLLARDPFGIKPLVYRRGPGYLAFASELNALLAVRDAPPTGSLAAVEQFLRFQYIPAPATIYHGVEKLPPAHFLAGDLDSGVGEPTRYWSLCIPAEPSGSEAEWEERVDQVLASAVEAHLVADTPVGTLLSGGVDSTIVTAEMSRLLGGRPKAFAIGFDDEQLSELPFAQQAAEVLGVELHHETQTDDFWPELGDMIHAYGEPFGDSSAIPTWRLARLAREQVPVVLSGDGGDEAFAGYWSYGAWLAKPSVRESLRELRRTPSREALVALFWVAARRWVKDQICHQASWKRLIAYTSAEDRRALWRPEHRWVLATSDEAFGRAHRGAPTEHLLGYAQHMDYETYLPGAVLTKVDIASMAHGLEVRTPFCDPEVVAVAMSLPMSLRYKLDDANGFSGKLLLKRKLAALIPPRLANRAKQGFGIPRQRWLLPGRPGYTHLQDVMRDPASRLGEIFEAGTIDKLLAQHSANRDRSGMLWLLLVLGSWLARHPRLVLA